MKKYLFLLYSIGIVVWVFSSCATMKNGSVQSVSFKSDPPGAIVKADNEILGVTPCEANIKRKSKETIIFSKDNYNSETVVLKGGFNNTTLWNGLVIPIWGFALIPIDYLTGAAYKYNNDFVFVKLNPESGYMASSVQTSSPNPPLVNPVNPQMNISDVAVNIPTTNTRNDKTFAVIIANEDYRREEQVIFAKNDGETFKKYCIQTLGLPEKNVHIVTDATLNDIRGEIDWISNVADAFKGAANFIFYYAGHGIPDETSKSAYLLPVDGYGANVNTGYKLDDLYQTLGKLPAKSITIFMDACFSGAQRNGEMLASARGVAIKALAGKPIGNMVVFSAAQGDETAYPYREKGHGMFTYFLLKKLQETKGETTLGELSNYITDNVRQQSIVINSKNQTPTVTPSTTLANRWQEMKLK